MNNRTDNHHLTPGLEKVRSDIADVIADPMLTETKAEQIIAMLRAAEQQPTADARLREALEEGPNIGAPTNEPGLRDIIFAYYKPHFDAAEALRLTNAYVAALSTPPMETRQGGEAA